MVLKWCNSYEKIGENKKAAPRMKIKKETREEKTSDAPAFVDLRRLDDNQYVR